MQKQRHLLEVCQSHHAPENTHPQLICPICDRPFVSVSGIPDGINTHLDLPLSLLSLSSHFMFVLNRFDLILKIFLKSEDLEPPTVIFIFLWTPHWFIVLPGGKLNTCKDLRRQEKQRFCRVFSAVFFQEWKKMEMSRVFSLQTIKTMY